MSTPDWSKFMAQVCLSVCGVTRLVARDGQFLAALATCLSTKSLTASVLRCPPVLVAKSGPSGSAPLSRAQACKSRAVFGSSGVQRSLRPFPVVKMFAPVPSNIGPNSGGELAHP
jgi:hypothetical protein